MVLRRVSHSSHSAKKGDKNTAITSRSPAQHHAERGEGARMESATFETCAPNGATNRINNSLHADRHLARVPGRKRLRRQAGSGLSFRRQCHAVKEFSFVSLVRFLGMRLHIDAAPQLAAASKIKKGLHELLIDNNSWISPFCASSSAMSFLPHRTLRLPKGMLEIGRAHV